MDLRSAVYSVFDHVLLCRPMANIYGYPMSDVVAELFVGPLERFQYLV